MPVLGNIYVLLMTIPVWRGCWRRYDPGLLLFPHGHDPVLLLGQPLHLRLQEPQGRVQPLDGASVLAQVHLSNPDTWSVTQQTPLVHKLAISHAENTTHKTLHVPPSLALYHFVIMVNGHCRDKIGNRTNRAGTRLDFIEPLFLSGVKDETKMYFSDAPKNGK